MAEIGSQLIRRKIKMVYTKSLVLPYQDGKMAKDWLNRNITGI